MATIPAITEDYSPIYVGDTEPLAPVLADKADNIVPLDGTSFALLIRNTLTGEEMAGTGDFIVTNADDGTFLYLWGPGETDTAGQYDLLFTVTKEGTTRTGKLFLEILDK